MIEISKLSKKYGAVTAVNKISFSIEKGEIVGFLGPNGAGKSTTMNIITGYLSPTSGEVKINGFDILSQPNKAKKNIGYLPEHPPLYLDMTPYEYLLFLCDLKSVTLNKKAHINEIYDLVKIGDMKNRLIKKLSKGYRQRVGIAGALIGNPDILILDEPTVGLDPKQIIEIRELIKDLSEGHTIIISSHILSEIEAVCQRVIIINNGVIVADDLSENLCKNYGDEHIISAQIKGDKNLAAKEISKILGVLRCRTKSVAGNVFNIQIETEKGLDLREEISKAITKNELSILEFYGNKNSLEDVFIKLTAKITEEEEK